jgi:hypothetical protein
MTSIYGRNLIVANVLILLFYSINCYTFGTSSSHNNRFSSVFLRSTNQESNSVLRLQYGGSIGKTDRSGLDAPTTTTSNVVNDFIANENLSLLSERGRIAIANLIRHDDQYHNVQKHVYSNWPERGTDDDGKRKLAEQVRITNEIV